MKDIKNKIHLRHRSLYSSSSNDIKNNYDYIKHQQFDDTTEKKFKRDEFIEKDENEINKINVRIKKKKSVGEPFCKKNFRYKMNQNVSEKKQKNSFIKNMLKKAEDILYTHRINNINNEKKKKKNGDTPYNLNSLYLLNEYLNVEPTNNVYYRRRTPHETCRRSDFNGINLKPFVRYKSLNILEKEKNKNKAIIKISNVNPYYVYNRAHTMKNPSLHIDSRNSHIANENVPINLMNNNIKNNMIHNHNYNDNIFDSCHQNMFNNFYETPTFDIYKYPEIKRRNTICSSHSKYNNMYPQHLNFQRENYILNGYTHNTCHNNNNNNMVRNSYPYSNCENSKISNYNSSNDHKKKLRKEEKNKNTIFIHYNNKKNIKKNDSINNIKDNDNNSNKIRTHISIPLKKNTNHMNHKKEYQKDNNVDYSDKEHHSFKVDTSRTNNVLHNNNNNRTKKNLYNNKQLYNSNDKHKSICTNSSYTKKYSNLNKSCDDLEEYPIYFKYKNEKQNSSKNALQLNNPLCSSNKSNNIFNEEFNNSSYSNICRAREMSEQIFQIENNLPKKIINKKKLSNNTICCRDEDHIKNYKRENEEDRNFKRSHNKVNKKNNNNNSSTSIIIISSRSSSNINNSNDDTKMIKYSLSPKKKTQMEKKKKFKYYQGHMNKNRTNNNIISSCNNIKYEKIKNEEKHLYHKDNKSYEQIKDMNYPSNYKNNKILQKQYNTYEKNELFNDSYTLNDNHLDTSLNRKVKYPILKTITIISDGKNEINKKCIRDKVMQKEKTEINLWSDKQFDSSKDSRYINEFNIYDNKNKEKKYMDIITEENIKKDQRNNIIRKNKNKSNSTQYSSRNNLDIHKNKKDKKDKKDKKNLYEYSQNYLHDNFKVIQNENRKNKYTTNSSHASEILKNINEVHNLPKRILHSDSHDLHDDNNIYHGNYSSVDYKKFNSQVEELNDSKRFDRKYTDDSIKLENLKYDKNNKDEKYKVNNIMLDNNTYSHIYDKQKSKSYVNINNNVLNDKEYIKNKNSLDKSFSKLNRSNTTHSRESSIYTYENKKFKKREKKTKETEKNNIKKNNFDIQRYNEPNVNKKQLEINDKLYEHTLNEDILYKSNNTLTSSFDENSYIKGKRQLIEYSNSVNDNNKRNNSTIIKRNEYTDGNTTISTNNSYTLHEDNNFNHYHSKHKNMELQKNMSQYNNISAHQNVSHFKNNLKQYTNPNYKKENYPLVKISNGIKKKKYILNNKRSGNIIYNKSYYSEDDTNSELYSNNTSEETKRKGKDITCVEDLNQSTNDYIDSYNSSKCIKEKRFDKIKTKRNNYIDDDKYMYTYDDVDDDKYMYTDDHVNDDKYIYTDDDVDDIISLYSNNNKSVSQYTKEEDEVKDPYISNRNKYIKLNKKMEGTKDHLDNKPYNSSKIYSYSKIKKKSNILNSKSSDNEYTNKIKNNIRNDRNNISNNKIYNDKKYERDKYSDSKSREVKHNILIDNINYEEKKNKYQRNKKSVNHESFLSTHEESKFFKNDKKKKEKNDISKNNSRSKSSYKKERYIDNSKNKNSSQERYENASESVIKKKDGCYKSLQTHEINKNIYSSNKSNEEKKSYFSSQSILCSDKMKNTSTQQIDGDTINKIVNHYDEKYIKNISDLDIDRDISEKDKVYKNCYSLKENKMIQKYSCAGEKNEGHDNVEIFYNNNENDIDKYVGQEIQRKDNNNEMNNNFISSEDINFKNNFDTTEQYNYGDKASTQYNINEDEKKNNDINNMCVNTIYSNEDENIFEEQKKKENIYGKQLKNKNLIKENYSLDIQNDKTKHIYTSHNIKSNNNIYNYQLSRDKYLQSNSNNDKDISFMKDKNITSLNKNDINCDKEKNINKNKYNKLLSSDIYKTDGNTKKFKQNCISKIIEEQNKNDQKSNYKNYTDKKDSIYYKDEIILQNNNKVLDESYDKDINNEHSNNIYHNNNIKCESLKSKNYNINHSNVNYNIEGKYLKGVVGINEANEYLNNQLNVLLKDKNEINQNENNNIDRNNSHNSINNSDYSSKENLYINKNDEIPIQFENSYTSQKIYDKKKENFMIDKYIDNYSDDKNKGPHFYEENINLYSKKLSDIKIINGKNTTNMINSHEVLLNKNLNKSIDIPNQFNVDENNTSTYIKKKKNIDNNGSIISTNQNNTIYNNNYDISVDNIKREYIVDNTSIHNVCSLDNIKEQNVLKKPVLNIISDDENTNENNKKDTVENGIQHCNNIYTMNGIKTNNYMMHSITMPNISNTINDKHMIYTNKFNEKNKMNIYNPQGNQIMLGEQGNYNNLFYNPNMVNNGNIKRILYNKALTTANIGHTHNNNNNNNNNIYNNNNNILYNQMNNDEYKNNKINTIDYLNKYRNMPMNISTVNKSQYANLQNDKLNNICILPVNPNIQQHPINYNMNTNYIPNNNIIYNNKLFYDESGKIYIRGDDKSSNNGPLI
ncbi:conserved Plasmodium protein, unknown function [Plasmodium sp. gorilla clade G2]|uniref:conserved Plasmodium protein, unknown function n=1 Tax=Plasmodium sp. gorilla clade G2 TaxID=880535 RepID=UPI000D1FEAC0|nr:conserved Plasmodium protein, unknown function [Plasmodium sp. gorilla clade G2]SOV16029.1 conserved Plasmodium protein, unknown function [Plasmodium sp. gorilla clade G2]